MPFPRFLSFLVLFVGLEAGFSPYFETAVAQVASVADKVLRSKDEPDREHAVPDCLALLVAIERSFHDACDEWYAKHREGKSTAEAAARIARAYRDFDDGVRLFWRYKAGHEALRRFEIVYGALCIIIPADNIICAGRLRSFDGSEYSYVAYRVEHGVVLTLWGRGPWEHEIQAWSREEHIAFLIRRGFVAAALDFDPAKLGEDFQVQPGDWIDPKRQERLRIPYKLKGVAGVIEIRRVTKRDEQTGIIEERWEVQPDRGTVTNGRWDPFAQ